MINNSESACCPKGSWGKLPSIEDESYKPKGEEVTLNNNEKSLPVYYVSSGSSSGKVLMVFTDVFGFSSRVKGFCDKLSSELQCTIIMPDILRGKTAEGKNEMEALFEWLREYPYDGLIQGDIDACIDFLSSKKLFSATSSIGFVGFCWGAWVVTKALATASTNDDDNWMKSVKCGVGLHPSTHVEKNVFKGDEEKMFSDVSFPFLLCTAGNDPENLKKGSTVVTHLESKGGKSKDYPDMVHGWTSRGDFSVENVIRDADDALQEASDFFLEKM